MPVTLPNLYCAPSDVDDYLGEQGVDLRLDDMNLSTGQTIKITADALVGATTVNCQALIAPLLRGTQLKFSGAGIPAVVYVTLSATAALGATSLAVNALTAQLNNQSWAQDSGVNVAWAMRMVKGCSYGTARVKLYCCSRYDDSELAKSWSVNWWSTVIASHWVSKRRSQSAPDGIEKDYEEVMDDLKQVKNNGLHIEDIGTRTSGWPVLANVTMDIRYDLAKLRVEPAISEQTPTLFNEFVDWNSVFLLQW